jgi:hypothetical protein
MFLYLVDWGPRCHGSIGGKELPAAGRGAGRRRNEESIFEGMVEGK